MEVFFFQMNVRQRASGTSPNLTIIMGHVCNVANQGLPSSLYTCFVYICEIPDTGRLFQKKKSAKQTGSTSHIYGGMMDLFLIQILVL